MAAATEQATAHASDPERVQRIRDLVGYDDDGERANSNTNEPTSERTLRREARERARQERARQQQGIVEDHRGLAGSDGVREGLISNEFQRKKKRPRNYGDPPSTIGHQTDSISRQAACSVL